MRALLFAVMLAACATPAQGPSAASALAPLIGCWRGAFGDGGLDISDERCFETLGQHVVDRHVVQPTGYSGETTYHYDEARGRIVFTYAASDGGRSHGFVGPAADGFAFPEHEYRGGDGVARRLRSRWTFEGRDRFVVVSEHDLGHGWRPLMRIIYVRARDLE